MKKSQKNLNDIIDEKQLNIPKMKTLEIPKTNKIVITLEEYTNLIENLGYLKGKIAQLENKQEKNSYKDSVPYMECRNT